MNFSSAAQKIGDITQSVNEHIDNINRVMGEGVDKINGYIDDLEKVINSAATKSAQWIEKKVKILTKKINDALEKLQQKLNGMIADLAEWYDTQINKAKACIIKANFAKLGQECSDDMAATMASAIPHPDFNSFIPEFNLMIELPALSNLSQMGEIKLPRLEI
jgi:ElaB/YqjD/DUF883 family membrane-anchored ribosome-binding protein